VNELEMVDTRAQRAGSMAGAATAVALPAFARNQHQVGACCAWPVVPAAPRRDPDAPASSAEAIDDQFGGAE
jgi:hypothetical protein